jgi:hypothetical protein
MSNLSRPASYFATAAISVGARSAFA